jgi:hypothetical protein
MGEGGGKGAGEEPNQRAWTSINHSILSGIQVLVIKNTSITILLRMKNVVSALDDGDMRVGGAL